MPDETTVFIVDDDLDMRKSLAMLLRQAGYKHKALKSAEEFLREFDPEVPGCILLDVHMSGMSGLELQTELINRHCLTPVIIITGHADIPVAVEAMKGGASGFLEKPFRSETLLQCIEDAIRDSLRARDERCALAALGSRMMLLTQREQQILCMVADGMLSGQIAHDLDISRRTVETHRANIMKKLQAETLAELVALAVEYGMRSSARIR